VPHREGETPEVLLEVVKDQRPAGTVWGGCRRTIWCCASVGARPDAPVIERLTRLVVRRHVGPGLVCEHDPEVLGIHHPRAHPLNRL
jgi:hypothetical protein